MVRGCPAKMPGDFNKTWQFFVTGYKGKLLTFNINKEKNIQCLLQMVAEEVGLKIKEIILLYAGKQLDPNTAKTQYFEDYDLHNRCTLVLVTRVRGGHNLKPTRYTRLVSPVRYSPEACIISDEDSIDGDKKRVRMPCSHAIVPDELKTYCRHKLKKGFYTFQCPIKTCKKVWSYSMIRRYAGLADDEMKEFEMKISENYAKHVLEAVKCPGCKSYCVRDDSDTSQQLRCPHCSADKGRSYFFCWECLGPWKKASREDTCGNDGCHPGDPRLEILHNCDFVSFTCDSRKVECPRIRACISCGTLNYFEKGCKRIPCKGCRFEFCLICVRPFVRGPKTGKGMCGYSVRCELGPFQTSIPKKRL